MSTFYSANEQFITPHTVADIAANDVPPTRHDILIAQARALEAFDGAQTPGERSQAQHDLINACDALKTSIGIESNVTRSSERDVERDVEAGRRPPTQASPTSVSGNSEAPTFEQLMHVTNNRLAMIKDRLTKKAATNAKPLCPKCHKRH